MQSFNILLLLIMCQCVFTYADVANKFFRKDYKFFKSTNSFYKIHTIHKSWKDAKAMCALEGASLLYPEDENEANVVAKFLTNSQPFWWLYIGAYSDLHSDFKTIDGVPASKKFYEWADGEPDGSYTQNCIVLTREATLKDADCTTIYPFICKKALSALQWNTPCNMPKQDTQFTKKFFRSGYTYLERTKSFYKLHMNSDSDWDDAKKECAMEEATLFYPEDKHEVDVVTDFMENAMSQSSWRIFIGASARFARGVYETINGVPVIDKYLNWASGEPSGRNDKDCMVLTDEGAYRDVDCTIYNPFICKRSLSSLYLNSLDILKGDYKYNDAVGRCYKFHLNPLSWSDAYATCAAEQSYLAIIDSEVEANVLVNLTAEVNTYKIPGNFERESVHLGFHNLEDNGLTGWITTKGVPLTDNGYSHWIRTIAAPADGRTPKCGSMNFNGQLKPVNCDLRSFFICEHEIAPITPNESSPSSEYYPFFVLPSPIAPMTESSPNRFTESSSPSEYHPLSVPDLIYPAIGSPPSRPTESSSSSESHPISASEQPKPTNGSAPPRPTESSSSSEYDSLSAPDLRNPAIESPPPRPTEPSSSSESHPISASEQPKPTNGSAPPRPTESSSSSEYDPSSTPDLQNPAIGSPLPRSAES